MREGSLDAPTRHIIDWKNPDFYDEQKLDDELRRVSDFSNVDFIQFSWMRRHSAPTHKSL